MTDLENSLAVRRTRRSSYKNIEVKSFENRRRTSRKTINLIIDVLDSETEPDSTPTIMRTPQKLKSTTIDTDLTDLSPVTPPKQKRTEKDENQETVPLTPSSLLKNLRLTSPPIDNNSKKEERNGVYKNARKALHGTFLTSMPGREKEHEELRSFINHHLKEKSSGTLYVSGPPGTGKTASLNIILEEEIASQFKEIYINCTSIKSSGSVYSKIVKELGIRVNGRTEKDNLQAIENYLVKNHIMTILVLDEIDQLESKKQSVLYTIFEWPSKPNSKLILIGIANALDLTDRILPRLQARCILKPKLMHFAPYTKQQIVKIFTSRLKEAGVLEVFSPVALEMLAGKVAAISGDVRRALDIGRRVIEIVEQNKLKGVLKSSENIVPNKLKIVDLSEVVGVLNNVYGTSQNLTDDCDESFPLQQKIVVCSLLLFLKKGKNKDITIGKLHEVYKRVCSKRNIHAVDQAEFVGLCSLVETKGIIRVVGKKEPRLHKVTLEWDEEEVSDALKDKKLLSMILQDDSCLGKM